MVAKIALSIAAVLAVAPAVVTVVWPNSREQAPERSVELHGPILGFTQSTDRIQVRLVPPRNDAEKNSRSRVVVRAENGAEFSIPLQHGQTWASASLPARLAGAAQIDISVE